MHTHADKTKENKSQSVANVAPEMQIGGESNFQFVDNRPEAIQMRKLQEIANKYSRKNSFQVVDNRPELAQFKELPKKALSEMQFSENSIITDNNSSLSLNESPTSAIIQGVFKRNPKNLFQWMDNDTHKVYEQFEVQIDNKIHLRGHGETFYIVSEQGIWNRVIPPRSRKLHDLSDGESESEDPNIVWRSLRKDEEPKKTGVRPPDGHDPSITASAHITAGSRARVKSPWVSTSRSRKVAAAWASESDKRVAKLQIPQDQDPSMHFDLTNPHHATTVFPTGKGSSLNTAKASQEVVLKEGLGPEQVLALYEARKIKVSEYNDIKKRLDDGEEIFIDGKKIYAAFRTRTTTTSRPEPRLLLELPDN